MLSYESRGLGSQPSGWTCPWAPSHSPPENGSPGLGSPPSGGRPTCPPLGDGMTECLNTMLGHRLGPSQSPQACSPHPSPCHVSHCYSTDTSGVPVGPFPFGRVWGHRGGSPSTPLGIPGPVLLGPAGFVSPAGRTPQTRIERIWEKQPSGVRKLCLQTSQNVAVG